MKMKTLDYSGSRQISGKLHLISLYKILYGEHLSKSSLL